MLLLRETHEVIGAREDEFEATFRDEWLPTLAQGDDASPRLLSRSAIDRARQEEVYGKDAVLPMATRIASG